MAALALEKEKVGRVTLNRHDAALRRRHDQFGRYPPHAGTRAKRFARQDLDRFGCEHDCMASKKRLSIGDCLF
jgi:hypothetical protein